MVSPVLSAGGFFGVLAGLGYYLMGGGGTKLTDVDIQNIHNVRPQSSGLGESVSYDSCSQDEQPSIAVKRNVFYARNVHQIATSNPVLVVIYAEWCLNSNRLGSITWWQDQELNVDVAIVHYGQHPEIASALGITKLPSFYLVEHDTMRDLAGNGLALKIKQAKWWTIWDNWLFDFMQTRILKVYSMLLAHCKCP